jgi:hypothetical protein
VNLTNSVVQFSVTAVAACMLAVSIVHGGDKNEKEDIASLVIAFVRLSLTRMRNNPRHGGRYTEFRESREENGFRRIGSFPSSYIAHNRYGRIQ